MSIRDLVSRLIDAGVDPCEAAEIVTLAAMEALVAHTVVPEDSDARRRASFREAGIGPVEWSERRVFILERDGARCCYCQAEAGPFEIDHVLPIARGGTHEVENLVVACRPCNRSKKDRTVEEWRGRL